LLVDVATAAMRFRKMIQAHRTMSDAWFDSGLQEATRKLEEAFPQKL
jgi:hypothetical protein